MFTIKRVSTVPASPMRVAISEAPGDGDAGLVAGGTYFFYPAGSEEGETEHSLGEAAARVIMQDPGMAAHFECTPALPGTPEAEPAAKSTQTATRRRKAQQADEQPTTTE